MPFSLPPIGTVRIKRTAGILAVLMLILAAASVSTAQAGLSSEPLPIGTANGLPASASAVLRPVWPGSVVRPYAHSALRLRSQLLDFAGQPISGARIDILQQVSGSSETQIVGHALTGPDGTFTALVPAGPSRTIDLAYRAYQGALLYTAQTEVAETVTAGLQLCITPRHTRPTGTIVLAGRVLGVVPPHGVVVEVLVYYQGAWEPIRTPRTARTGWFRLRYRFHQALGRFPFALRVRDGQAGFPYAEGSSAWVAVVT